MKLPVATLPDASVAVHVTVVVSMGNVVPLAGEQNGVTEGVRRGHDEFDRGAARRRRKHRQLAGSVRISGVTSIQSLNANANGSSG